MKSGTKISRASTVSFAAPARGKASGTPLRLLSVDPGLNGTGVMYWHDGEPKRCRVLYPSNTGSQLDGNEDDELVVRGRNLSKKMRAVTSVSSLEHTVVIEFPEYQEGARGAVARRTGSMDKLSFLIGVMVGELPKNWRVYLPRVRDWKGQLPKDVVIRRLQAHYGMARCAQLGVRSHAWDAFGIGHWFLHQRG